jgi:hypothetical protein
VKHILENVLPIVNDPMSYGGNTIVNTHLFHYFLALFDILLPDFIVYKIIPTLLACSIVFIVYYFAKKVTNNEYAALFGALLSAFIPVYISNTINQISILSAFVPLFFLVLYLFIEIKEKKRWFLFAALGLVLLQPLNFLMIFTLGIFCLLMLAESLSIKTEEFESMGFFVVLFLLANLIFYKRLYLEQGIAAIWQNLPLELYGNLFQNFDILNTIGILGFIPLIFGIAGFIIYKEKNRIIAVLSSVLLADFALLLLKLIPFEEGLIFLAVVLCITASIALEKLIEYIKITKTAKYEKAITWAIVVIGIASLIIPSFVEASDVVDNGVITEEIEALHWIKFNTPRESVIAGNVYEGNLIIWIADRTNVIDTQFFYAENRINYVNTIFETESLVKAKKSLDKYGADYIYLSKKSKEMYDINELKYTKDESCFEEVFSNEFATIYEVVC